MKRYPFLLLAIAILLFACNNNKPKEVTVKSEDGKEKVSVEVNPTQNAADMQKQAEDLQKLSPLTLEQLKALMPVELMGAKQSNYSGMSMSGASNAKADFKPNDSTGITLNIFDCAGSAGAGIYSAQYMMMLNIQQEDDNGYTKTVDFMGQRALEHCEKARKECTLTYFTGGRYLVTMEGNNVSAEELKKAAESIQLK